MIGKPAVARPAALGAALRRAIDVVLPPSCPACRRAVAQPDALCAACWSSAGFIAPPVCAVYGTPFAYDVGAGALSAAAIADPPPFSRARAAVAYGEVAKHLVHALKYRDRPDVAAMMAAAMTRAGAELLADAGLLVPVPLHPWRLWRRRFNQSALLAALIAERAGVACDPFALVRSRRTRQQVGLSAREREENVRGAFRVPEARRAALAGRRILLVDDVYTSGATVKAAARALLRAEAEAVDVLTFARVLSGL